MQLVENLSAWKSDWQIHAQFVAHASGGEDGRTLCVALFDEPNNSYVGFLGLTLAIEDLQSETNAFVAVEFVYLHPQVRGLGLSSHFIKYAMEEVAKWLQVKAFFLTGRVVTLYSASNVKSDAGQHFVSRLEALLRDVASARGWSFTSSIDDEG